MTKKLKTLDTLVEDIYNKIGVLADGEHIDLDPDSIEQFGESMKEILYKWSHPEPRGDATLRMSNIGRKSRQLWFDMKSEGTPERMPPSLFIKLLYGHLLEEIVIFLIKLSGHDVTDEQKEIKVSGIKGHMDCVIDGEVVDIKTASGYAFKKFKDGTLAENDMFGYMPGNYYSWSMTLCFMLFQYILLMLSSEEIRGPLTTKNDMGYYKCL